MDRIRTLTDAELRSMAAHVGDPDGMPEPFRAVAPLIAGMVRAEASRRRRRPSTLRRPSMVWR